MLAALETFYFNIIILQCVLYKWMATMYERCEEVSDSCTCEIHLYTENFYRVVVN